MPNGGSDCCMTCPFNVKNKGHYGYDHVRDPGPDFCRIRDLPIDIAAYTYCANHPHHNPSGIEVPVGPVLVERHDPDRGDLGSGPREIWKPSPDSDAIRNWLLDQLSRMQEPPPVEYPIGPQLDVVVIWQLGEFREARAIEGLRRIAGFDPSSSSGGVPPATREATVAAAREALAKIEAP